ncbi:uncharacterized protein [Littorina saxatilis]|uniref:uncharacterized protein n=1 Tax=Littorina saxatilis TaxID=31220 RepID=UPI0038B4D547
MAWYNPQWICLVIALNGFCTYNASTSSTTRKPVRTDSQSTSNDVSNVTTIPASNEDKRQLEFEATTAGTSHWIREGTSLVTPRFPGNTETEKHPTQILLTHHGNSENTSAGNPTEHSGSFHRSEENTRDTFTTHYSWNKETTSAKDFLLGYNPGVCRDGRYISEFKDTNPYVFPCECTPGCEMYGTCCPDNATDLMSASFTGCARSGWYVLTKCPAGWNDDSIRENCEEGRSMYPNEDLVSDPTTNVTYRNAFCALCHGVSSFTRWPLNISCNNFQKVYSAVTQREFLQLALASYCHVASSPPDGTYPRKCEDTEFSNIEIVGSCDTTRLSKGENYEKDAAANCLLYNAHILLVRYRFKVYQNLFCAICMGADPISWPSTSSPGLEQIAQVRATGFVHAYHNTSRDDAEFALVHTLFYTDWNIVFKDKSIRLTPTYISQPAKERLALPRELTIQYAPHGMLGPERNLVLLSPALICPYVKFSHNTFKLQAAGDRGENIRLVLTAVEGAAEVTDLRHTFLDEDSLYVCYDALKNLRRPTRGSAELDWQYVLTMVMMPLSMLCLLLTLAVYCLLPSLRTQPGLNTMCTCTALLLAQLSLLVAVHAQGTTSRPWCQVLGAVVHAAWLQVFCWTSICSVHMFRAFSAKTYGHGSLSSTSRCCSWQTACNIGISVVVPVFITGVVAVARFVTTNGRSVGYSAVSCYLESTVLVGVSMVLPASLLQLFNLTLFVLTVRRIHEVMRLNPRSEDQQESQRHVHVCARLSLLTGITWLIAFVAEGLNVDWLQFVSILANGGQGVMILLSYAATRRIVAMVAVKVGWEPRERSSSSQSTNSTFQSRNA